MPRDRGDLLVNFERMWREMDEMLDASRARAFPRHSRSQPAFKPRVDVYYCGEPQGAGDAAPRAVVKVELAGVDPESVGLEVAGRELVITGERPLQETEGRVYQQLEIEAGPFRRVVQLGTDVVAERAKASYEDGILRVELPLRPASDATHQVRIEPRDD
ncbi:MAG TPA: Hsp20/alpha crystallin family protein [Solirubrobacterales bacterium]|nr:Hsp20/alpha crystallin family protein [Solirubrobacterales bacterium]